jgi:hypothetical protein
MSLKPREIEKLVSVRRPKHLRLIGLSFATGCAYPICHDKFVA